MIIYNLGGAEHGVSAVELQQLRVRAELHHPLVNNSDLVCVLDGGQSVSDGHGGARLLPVELVEGGLDNLRWSREIERERYTRCGQGSARHNRICGYFQVAQGMMVIG